MLYLFTAGVISYETKLLMFYTVQTTNLTFENQIREVQETCIIALC